MTTRIVIVSHTPHYRRDGVIVGWGATIREIDHLATLFDEVVHVAPLHDEQAPASAIPYEAANVHLRAVRPAGGERLIDKPGIVLRFPAYAGAILEEYRRADVAHVRCPANISLLAVLLLALVRNPRRRWVKYAGNWNPDPGSGEALSYRIQRWLLRRNLPRAVVTVNGSWPGSPPHLVTFMNPCLTDDELREGAEAAAHKRLTSPLHLVYVGRIETAKGAGRALQIVHQLKERGLDVRLDLAGDGPELPAFQRMAGDLGLAGCVRFLGAVSRPDLAPLYARAHFIVLPSASSEGWPKVLSEAMAYGAVPITSNISSIAQYLAQARTGRTFQPADVNSYVEAIVWYSENPAAWQQDSQNGVAAAPRFSYTAYLKAVKNILEL